MTTSNDKRGYTVGRYALEIENVSAGWIYSAEGGGRVSEVVVEKLATEHRVRKHLGGLKYEDITVVCGIGMSQRLYDLIKMSFDDNARRFDGAIHACDYDGNIKFSLEFHQALIAEIGFPALDAASKDPAKLTIKLTPEWTRTKSGHGKIQISQHPLGKSSQMQQKKWLPSNFRLRIDGLDDVCAYVNKIEPLTIKQKIVENAMGELRYGTREPAGLELPNLVITASERVAGKLYKWEKDFIIDGNCDDSQERTGTLEYLTSDLKDALFSIDMDHIGLFKVSADKMDSGGEAIRRIKAEMYMEDIKFKYTKNAIWA